MSPQDAPTVARDPAPAPAAGPEPSPATGAEHGLKAVRRDAPAEDEQGAPASRPAAQPDADGDPAAGAEDRKFDIGRVAWLVTVLACLVTVTILVLEGYFGYAGVALAVALAAAINLL